MPDTDNLFTPASIGPVTLRNRTIRSAAFEGMGKDNNPTPQLKDYHVAVAKGGVGMTTLAYAGICKSALSFKTQLWLRRDIVKDLTEITDEIHAYGAKASIQIGHCGNMTHRSTSGGIPVGASTGFNLYSPTFVRALRKEEIKKIAKDFGVAVNVARDAGFDCVEMHAGHGYLISQFLSPYTNHRHDEYGGSLENRMRFMIECTDEIMKAAGSDIGILAKMNMNDGFKSGMQEEESLEVAKTLQEAGVHALVLSGGFVSKAPMYVMRGEMPIRSMTHYMEPWWLKYAVRMFGGMMVPSEPFKPLYFLDQARMFRKNLDLPLVYVGGVTSREDASKIINEEGFEFLQMGRALLNDTDFVNKMKANPEHKSECEHVNYCIARMYSKDMACYRHVSDLPSGLCHEIEKIKKKNASQS